MLQNGQDTSELEDQLEQLEEQMHTLQQQRKDARSANKDAWKSAGKPKQDKT